MLRSLIIATMLLFVSNAFAGEPGAAAEAPAASLSLRSIAAGTDVQGRALVGEGVTFVADGSPVWVHVAVANRGAPSHVTMVWFFEGAELWKMDLTVGKSAGWRTWSRSTMGAHRVGSWRVEVRDPAGAVLGETRFEVIADEPVRGRAALSPGGDEPEPGC